MNKAELVDYVAESTGIFKKDARGIVDAVLIGIKNGLMWDGKVTLAGFGNFQTVSRAARKGRNPKTGVSVNIRAKKVPTFRPSEQLKDAVD
jgi:DNA-binding protein HU-beta